jgi:hypothetical protein
MTGKSHAEDLDVDVRILLKFKEIWRVQTGFIDLGIRTSGGLMTNNRGICIAKRVLAS